MTEQDGTARDRDETLPPGFGAFTTPSGFSGLVGPIYDDVGDGSVARRGFRVQDKHINRAGIAHGGMLMTFADVLLARRVRAAGVGPAVTVRMTSDFLGPARLGDWVEGTARVTRSTESLVFVEAEIRAGGHAVMTASGIFRRIRPRRGLEAPATAD